MNASFGTQGPLRMVDEHTILESGADDVIRQNPWCDHLRARALDHRTSGEALAWMANPVGAAPAPIEGAEGKKSVNSPWSVTFRVYWHLAANPALPAAARAEWLANPSRGAPVTSAASVAEDVVGKITAATTATDHALWAALYPEAVAGNPLAPSDVLWDLARSTGPVYVWGRALITLGHPWSEADGWRLRYSGGEQVDHQVCGRQPRVDRIDAIAREVPRLRCTIAAMSETPTATLRWLAEDWSLDALHPRGQRIGALTRDRARAALEYRTPGPLRD